MPIPVISTTTSVLGYRRAQQFAYQMQATETPTSWTAAGLPAGLSINNSGLITGAASVAGVYLVKVIATNGTGPSLPLNVAMGIEESLLNDGLGIGVNVDLISGAVTVPGIPIGDGKPSLFLKYRDIVFLDVGFFKGEVLQEMNVVEMKLNLREFDGETSLVDTNGSIENVGPSDKPRYRIAVDLNSAALINVLGGYESDLAASFIGIAELEWKVNYSEPTAILNDLVRSSQTFRVSLTRDLIPNS